MLWNFLYRAPLLSKPKRSVIIARGRLGGSMLSPRDPESWPKR